MRAISKTTPKESRMPNVNSECKPVVLWKAPFYDPSGYGDEARHLVKAVCGCWPIRVSPAGRFSIDFVKGMKSEDRTLFARLQDQPLTKDYIFLVQLPVYGFSRHEQALYSIGRTVFETDRLPAPWVKACNNMDEIWVPTNFNVHSFRRSGVQVPIHVVPQGIDAQFFRPGLQALSIPGRRSFAFLSVFEWSYRKGWDLLLRAWADAFDAKEDVCLILRTYPMNAVDAGSGGSVILHKIHEFLREEMGISIRDVAPIIVLATQIPDNEMPRLYASADAFVLPSRGEGWGRPYMEAMACGLPVIGTRWGGNLAFMDAENSYLVDIEGLEEVGDQMEIDFYRGHRWAVPSLNNLKFLMRRVYDYPQEARLKALRARHDVAEKWNWQMAAEKVLNRLEALSRERIKRPSQTVKMTHASTRAMPVEVVWEGPQFVYSSLALINREICLNLMDRDDLDLCVWPKGCQEFVAENDIKLQRLMGFFHRKNAANRSVHIRHEWPPNFFPPERGHWVMIQPWEYGRLPRQWVGPMSALVDELWVPSRHVWKTYVSSGVPAERVQIVPNGVNLARFRPDVEPLSLKTNKRFKFLFVGGTIWRKGVDLLLTAYQSTFRSADDVALVIKDIGQNSFYKGQGAREAIKKIQEDLKAPEIIYIDENLGENAMAGLFKACDCLVHPYRGEGFALPVLEAMACGLPVIVTEGGATDDFCLPEFTYKIKATRRNFTSPEIDFAGGAGWVLEPNVNDLQRLLLHVYENRSEAIKKAERAAEYVHRQYSWGKIADRVAQRIHCIVQKPIARLQHR